ncbi:MAG: PQQ-like beta-propeller repeat protein [Planctomycetota bacterium]|nr:PQQ-like beta-propeller repeat protein [Planctomycetota bacterium]
MPMNRCEMRWTLLAMAGLLAGTVWSADAPGKAAGGSPKGDWPQWRGPARDGLASAGPKLLDAWPKEGPRQVWRHDAPGWDQGGSGCVSVANGKAVYFVNWAHFTPAKLVTPEYVASWGWAPNMPADLVKLMEDARVSEDRKKLKAGPDLDAYIKAFLDKLPPEQSKSFGEAVTTRLTRGHNSWNWTTMEKLAASADKEFQNPDEVRAAFKDTNIHHNDLLSNELSVTIRKGQTYTDTLVCLDAETGKECWTKEFAGTFATMWGGNFMACGTPAIEGEFCYVAGSQGIYCVALKDGREVWKVPARYSNSSVLVLNGAVYVLATPSEKPVTQMGGELHAFNAATGQLLWKQPKVRSGWGSSVVAWEHGGKAYLVANSDNGVFCADPANGNILWQAPGGGSSTAAISGDTMVVHSGKIRAYKLAPDKCEVLWETNAGGDRFGSPLIYDGCVYFEGAYQFGFGCLDLKDGAMKWVEKKEVGHCSSPIVADGKLYALFSANGKKTGGIRMYKPTGEKFEEMGRFVPNATSCTSPVIANGKLYLRQDDGVACYDLAAR